MNWFNYRAGVDRNSKAGSAFSNVKNETRSQELKSKLSYLGLVLILSAFIFSGCRPAKEVKLDASANGSQVELQRGQILVISLESNPTTGYQWEVVELDEAFLRQVGEAEFKPESELLGAGGTETFRFEAVSAGKMPLALAYHRLWEEGVEPLETFSLEVVVR